MRPPHLTSIAAALMTLGGGVWATAMAAQPASPTGGLICGLHQATAAVPHCGWCYVALALTAMGAGLLTVAGARLVAPGRRRLLNRPLDATCAAPRPFRR